MCTVTRIAIPPAHLEPQEVGLPVRPRHLNELIAAAHSRDVLGYEGHQLHWQGLKWRGVVAPSVLEHVLWLGLIWQDGVT